MIDAWTPYRVVTFFPKDEGSGRQLQAEATLDEQDDGRPLFVGVPGVALLTGWMDAPLNLERFGRSDADGVVNEVANQPPAVVLAVDSCVAHVPVVRHHAPTSIAGEATRDTVSNSARRRRPSRKAKSPSLLHFGAVASACRLAV